MIYVANDKGSKEYLSRLLAANVPAELAEMPSSDFCFTGEGPDGERISIGVELKKITELTTYKRTRLARQAPRLANFFDRRYLIVEGDWSCTPQGKMTWFRNGRWQETAIAGGADFPYAYIDNHLTSMAEFADLQVKTTSHDRETAQVIVGLYKWWQKPYAQHALEMGHDVSLLPAKKESEGYTAAVTLVTRMLESISGIGPGTALLLAQRWDTPKQMMEADVDEWLMKGVIGKKKAEDIRRQLWGEK